MAKQKTTGTYKIKSEFLGKDLWTILPDYTREDGAKFILSEELPQTDLAFLYEVIGFEGIEIV